MAATGQEEWYHKDLSRGENEGGSEIVSSTPCNPCERGLFGEEEGVLSGGWEVLTAGMAPKNCLQRCGCGHCSLSVGETQFGVMRMRKQRHCRELCRKLCHLQ